MLVLTVPTISGELAGRPSKTVQSEVISIGSPSFVPVPCDSMLLTWSAVMRAEAWAARMTICCEGPLGTVRPELRAQSSP